MNNTFTPPKKLSDYLERGNIAFYGYRYDTLPDFVDSKNHGTSRIFISEKSKYRPKHIDPSKVEYYKSLIEMRDRQADVIFLDHNADNVLLAKFPVTSKYILVRLVPRTSWIFALPGLLRRLFVGLVKIEGVKKIKIKGKETKWIVIRHLLSKSLQTRFSISEEVGIQGFLDYLRSCNIKYVVLRFFEKLPNLNRVGGDVDILVSDEDEDKIRQFLQDNPGTIGVDVWTPSRSTHNSITYYPPPLARKIIEGAVDGPAGSKIPSPEEAFLSFAYHCLYHKGYISGIPSHLINYRTSKKPENDYAGVLKNLATMAGVNIDINMESVDEFLSKKGWRPKMDTLAKIAPWNSWVKKRFFSGNKQNEIGLGVFILKNKVLELDILDDIVNTIASDPYIKIIRIKKFNDSERDHVTKELRGGVWDDISGSITDFVPAVAIVVLDMHTLKSAKAGVSQKSIKNRTREFKKILRTTYDKYKVSLVHSTDFTYEAWEYIDDCFPAEMMTIKKEIEDIYESVDVPVLYKIRTILLSLPTRFKQFLFRVKKDALGKIIQYIVD